MTQNIGVSFNGKQIIKPGAYSSIDVSGLDASGSSSQKTIVFVGSAESGEPNKVHYFRNSTDARAVLRGGDLYKAGVLAWSPSNDTVSAGKIGFLRVENAERARAEKGSLTLISKIYGEVANRIQTKIEDGSLPASKRLSIYFWTDNAREIYDNIGPIFNIQYTGEKPYSVVNITTDEISKEATTLEILVGDDEQSAVTLASYQLGNGQFSEINKLLNDLNAHQEIQAKIVGVGNKNIPTKYLDKLEKADIKGQVLTVTALRYDLYNQLRFSRLVDASFDLTKPEPENYNYEYMVGGTNGTVPASWADKFELIQGQDAYIIVPLTGDEAIHNECAVFTSQMTNDERHEMRGVYGGNLGETPDQAVNRAVTLNSSHAHLVYPGVSRTFTDGSTEMLAPYFTAAIVAGRMSGREIGEPITLDSVNITGVERVLTSTELEKLLEAGVTPIEYSQQVTSKGYRISQGLTTYQDTVNPALRESSISEIQDFLNMELREKLEAMFVGKKGTASSPSVIRTTVQSFLDQKVRDNVIIEYDEVSVNVVLEGGVVYVNYAVMPAFGINYVLISGKFYRKAIQA